MPKIASVTVNLPQGEVDYPDGTNFPDGWTYEDVFKELVKRHPTYTSMVVIMTNGAKHG